MNRLALRICLSTLALAGFLWSLVAPVTNGESYELRAPIRPAGDVGAAFELAKVYWHGSCLLSLNERPRSGVESEQPSCGLAVAGDHRMSSFPHGFTR